MLGEQLNCIVHILFAYLLDSTPPTHSAQKVVGAMAPLAPSVPMPMPLSDTYSDILNCTCAIDYFTTKLHTCIIGITAETGVFLHVYVFSLPSE